MSHTTVVEGQPGGVGLTKPDIEHDDPAHLDWSKLEGVIMARTEIGQLTDSYFRCFDTTSTGNGELALITGPSGVGKTSLALALQKQVSDDKSVMITGKFDQLENNLQAATTQVYSAFTDAFTQYVEFVMDAGTSTVQSVKQSLEDGMESAELQVLLEMIPALDKILALQHCAVNQSSTLKGADAEERLIEIVTFFFRTICSQETRIILFLDDLQWANRSALTLLINLLVSSDEAFTSPFMLLCTCRMNEVSEDHPLRDALRDINDHGAAMTEIQVCDMTLDEVNHVVSNVLHLSISDSRPLSEALHQGTDGNLLFLIELVKFLCSDHVILYEDGRWMWDMAKVNAATGMSSIGRLIKEKYHRLDSNAQELLRVASCLGSTFSVELLSFTETADASEINNLLQDLENLGFIYFDKKQCSCRFVHDKVQQTIYQLTPEDVLAQLHLNIGRKLREKIPEVLVAKNVLLISHQISLGLHLIYDPREKQETAELFLLAAQQAALSSSFVTATAFVHLAIRLLSRRHWREQYQLSLQMYNFAAELEYYNGNLRRVDELVESVIQHAASFDDSLVARFTRIYSLGTRDNMQEGLHESLGVLDSLGERLPRKPGILNIVFGLIRCKHILRGKTDDYILSLPQMTDKKKQAAMRLMIFSIVFAFYVSGEHVPLIAFRLIRNTLRHGISPMACAGFGCLGMVYAFQGNIDEACRYSHLALKIFEKYNATEWHARIGTLVYGMVFPLKYPLRECLGPLYAAHRSSLVLGDIHFSMLCNANYSSMSYFAGVPLPRVLKEARRCLTLCVKYGQHSVQAAVEVTVQFALNLMGQSNDPLILTGDACDEEEVLRESAVKNPVNYIYIYFVKLQLAVYMNDAYAAKIALENLRTLDETKTLPFMVALLNFFEGLAHAMSSTREDILFARKFLTKLKVFAKHAPCNYLSKVNMIEAELAARAGKFDEAMAKFALAIQQARQEGLVNDHALACERAAYVAQSRRRPLEAEEYLTIARTIYLEWGALAKATQLTEAISFYSPRSSRFGFASS